MKQSIHPNYHEVKVDCNCGNSFTIQSTYAKDTLHIDVCNACHPFNTGKQQQFRAAGQVDKFRKKYQREQDADKQGTTAA